jgi:PAS domain S-box-containing protein
MTSKSGAKGDKKAELKKLFQSLDQGADPAVVKEKFKDVIKDVTAVDIALVEQELINEGMSQEKIQVLCDVHMAVMQEALDKSAALAPPGHPVNILMEEHKLMLNFAGELNNVAGKVKEAKNFDAIRNVMEHLGHIVKHFKESESHYLREENVLFPYLEKHGVTQPPAIMWMEHDKIREIKKGLYRVVETCQDVPFKDFAKELEASVLALVEMLNSHFNKENSILFPTALNVIPEGEWKDIRHQFDELGYCCFTPDTALGKAAASEAAKPAATAEGAVAFETGSLSPLEVEAIFNHLPVDITFVDKDDTVRYFSQAPDRIFPRAKAVVGRKVQQCHPQKSVHVVQEILDDFRSGKRSLAQFWINLKGRLILIRYFAVRSQKGGYLGCLEVSQDITDIKKIEGEKRLLDT